MTKSKKNKLTLKRKALRTLSPQELGEAAGGMSAWGCTGYCTDPNDGEPQLPAFTDFPCAGTMTLRHQTGS